MDPQALVGLGLALEELWRSQSGEDQDGASGGREAKLARLLSWERTLAHAAPDAHGLNFSVNRARVLGGHGTAGRGRQTSLVAMYANKGVLLWDWRRSREFQDGPASNPTEVDVAGEDRLENVRRLQVFEQQSEFAEGADAPEVEAGQMGSDPGFLGFVPAADARGVGFLAGSPESPDDDGWTLLVNDHDKEPEGTWARDGTGCGGRITRYSLPDDMSKAVHVPGFLDHRFYYPQDIFIFPPAQGSDGDEILVVADGANEHFVAFNARTGGKKLFDFKNPLRWPWRIGGGDAALTSVFARSDDGHSVVDLEANKETHVWKVHNYQKHFAGECMETVLREDDGITFLAGGLSFGREENVGERYDATEHLTLMRVGTDGDKPTVLAELNFGVPLAQASLDTENGVLVVLVTTPSRHVFVFDLGSGSITKSARKR